MWSNWAREQHCAPAAVERPRSTAEVVAAVERAADAGRVVRAVGSGHSFTDVALTNGHMVRLDGMASVLDADRASGLVRVGAGITLRALSARLAELGLALENLGDIDRQTVAGATATATHGTGARLRNLSAQVESLELVTGTGEVVELSETSDPDGWRAARVGVGSLGVVTALTLRCIPAFNLHAVEGPLPLGDVLDGLDEHADANDHFEFFAFPYTDVALTKTNNRTGRPAVPPARRKAFMADVVMGNGVFSLACRLGRRFPRRIPSISRRLVQEVGRFEVVDRSDRVFASPRLVHFTEMEYALPRAEVAGAVREVFALVERERLAVSFPIEVRFVAGDDALLSPAHERETGYVAVHVYRGMAWEPYFRAVAAIMDARGGRPHWGKRHFHTAATLAPRYPEWDRFAAVRGRLDPEGRFESPFAQRVLGALRDAAPTAEKAVERKQEGGSCRSARSRSG